MLDKAYNVEDARNSLEQSAAENLNPVEDFRLGRQFKDGHTFDEKFIIRKTENPDSWHLIDIHRQNETTMEEAVFTVQGVLVSKDLPPLQEKPKISAQRFKYLRQRIVLTGLGSPTFMSALEAASEVYGCFDRQFSEGILDSWISSEENCFGFPCLTISNRYLTPEKEARGQDVAFQKGVDPRGILRGMMNADSSCLYVHTEDNQVQYFVSSRDKNGSLKFQQCEPQTFRNGDIVQAQLSFVVIPVKGGHRKMLTVLRSLALLDRSFGQVNTNIKQKSDRSLVPTKILKRRVGYDEINEIDEQEGVRSTKRNKMDLDTVSSESASGTL